MMGMMPMMMMGSGGMGGMATIDRIEGRIAFLKTELKITDAQGEVWNSFADALRGNSQKLRELRSTMTPQGTLADRLAWQEKWLTERAEGTHAIRAAYVDLSAKLSDEQKASAEQLLAPHMGMMAMMSGTGSGQSQMMGGMGVGQTGMGQMGMGMGSMGSGQMPMMPGNPMTTGRTPSSK
jgi:LTXXQ motif family protein